jgi:sec-independent protein translocase protein TatB
MATPPPIVLANLGMADSLILMVMALVVFGPRRLPQIGRQIGKLMYEFRKASNDFKFQMEEELRSAEEADRRKKEEDRIKALALTAPTPIETPVVAATTLTESPYSEGMPAQADTQAAKSLADNSNEDGVTHPPLNDATTPTQWDEPRIMPPATGDPVAAAWPNRRVTGEVPKTEPRASELSPDVAPTDAVPGNHVSASEVAEQAAHHG